ncbi:MAG: GAF domain-containing protein [Candidatus Dormibacteraeota bacterium]|nr:GAF domain-containing protein [Candidatus Dormibacteraeota bacterium]
MSYDRSRRDLLIEAGLALAAELSLPALLQRIVELAAQVTDARYGALGITDAEGRISDFITTGISAPEREAIGPLPTGRGLLGAVIAEGVPIRTPRIADDPRSSGFPPGHPPMTTFLGAPLTSRGTVFGNIYLTEKRGGAEFTEQDENDLMVLAAQASVAVANATLYEDVRRRELWLEAVRQISLSALQGTRAERLRELICRLARGMVEADRAVVVSEAAAPEGGRGRMGPRISVALRGAGRGFGELVVSRRRDGGAFSASDRNLLERFAEQASVALAYQEAHQDAERLAVLAERERIAQDLHDHVSQSLFGIGLSLEGTAALVEGSPAEESLQEAVSQIEQVIRDLRSHIFALRPPAPDEAS